MQARLLLSTQRSGSHFLKSIIESRFSGVVCSGEVLEEPLDTQSPVLPAHPQVQRFWKWYGEEVCIGHISTAPSERIPIFESYLSHLSRLTEPNELVIDVKYSCVRSLSGYEDTDHGSTDFTGFIQRREIPVLHLIRRNILKILISHELARQTGIWHRANEKEASEQLPKIHLDPTQILRAIRNSDRLTQDYKDHFSSYTEYHEVVYEDLVSASETPEAIADFLGKQPVETAPASTWCKKTTPDDLSEIVENWEVIVSALRNTKYAWMSQNSLSVAA